MNEPKPKTMAEILAAKSGAKTPEASATDTIEKSLIPPTPETSIELAAIPTPVVGPPGSYRALRLERYMREDGTVMLPDADGFFIPETEEEWKAMEHYTKQWGMVEKQPDAETEN